MDVEDPREIIEHFSHGHPLKLIRVKHGIFITCYCCGIKYRPSSTAKEPVIMYACTEEECSYSYTPSPDHFHKGVYLCLLCAGLGESLAHHALHPQHSPLPLRLVNNNNNNGMVNRRVCGACCTNISRDSFSYLCDHNECGFEMHVMCAHSLNPTLQHRSHSHLLILLISLTNLTMTCGSCHGKIGFGTCFARCVPCNLNYHINCKRPSYSMPEMLSCPQRHPQHPLSLTLRHTGYSSCDVCGKKSDGKSTMYTCLECNNFMAHLSCAVRYLPCPFSRSVQRSNFADLRIKDSPMHEAALCQVCKKRMLSAYGCQYCNFFVHESCIRKWSMVGERIYGHPGYDSQGSCPLVLVFSHGARFTCACCNKPCSGFMFHHEKHKWFVLDLECMFLVPSLELIGHDHLVTLLQDRNTTKTSYLRCIPCCKSFSIAKSSCRFPHMLLHGCHPHPLTLVPYLVDDDQCYCDICEDKRDPNECIYYCGECKFEAHIGCVKQEVVGPSRNKRKDVKYVTLQEIKEDKELPKIKIRDVFRLEKELQHSYEEEFDGIFQIASRITWENSVGENPSYNIEFLNKVVYSDEPFKKFIHEINSASFLEKIRSTLESLKKDEVVRVGEYLVPSDLEQVVETVLDEYGDFGKECTCSRDVKHYLFLGLCKALQSMCNTKVVRVTESLLVEWWTWFIIGKAAGFKIQFALQVLRRVIYAHFGLEADKYADGKLTSVCREMREVAAEMEELGRKLEELRRELDEKRRRLEGLKDKEKELREAAFRVKKSPMMRECLKEAEDLVCCSIRELFLPPSH